MLKNYLKVAWRNIVRHKTFSLINLMGLSVGIAVCMFILHYVQFEKSYDKFHDKSENIYRLRYERHHENGASVQFASSTPPAAIRIRGVLPEVEEIGRILRYKASVTSGERKFFEDRMYFAEADFAKVLQFEYLSGDPVSDLAKPNHAFVSQTTAQKYFGDENPIGKTISVDKRIEFKVVGIFKDIRKNSHLKFDILLSFENLFDIYGKGFNEEWGHSGAFTYLKVKDGADIDLLASKIKGLVDEELGEALKQYKMELLLPLQKLDDIHLNSKFLQEHERNGDRGSINQLFIIAIFILVMAWINYVNLSTARALDRAKEVGLRKVSGASRVQLIIQLFCETIIINGISIAGSILIIKLLYPLFNSLTMLPSDAYIFNSIIFWISLTICFLIGVIISGIYPVIAISSFNPLNVIKGRFSNSQKGIVLRKGLVVLQFGLAIILVVATLTIYQQLKFMHESDLGVEIEKTIVVKAPRVRGENFESVSNTFKQELMNISNIKNVCLATEMPGRQIYWDAGGIYKASEDYQKSKNYQIVGIDERYIDLYNLEILYGRNFRSDSEIDTASLILNETAATFMGFENSEAAIGEKVSYWQKIYTIVGVLKDFHQQSLKEEFEPHIYRYLPTGRGVRGAYAIKYSHSDNQAMLNDIKTYYSQLFPDNPFEYYYLEEYYKQQYLEDELFASVSTLFALLGIFITGLGIFGLASFNASKRKREIGIRKVLGANSGNILVLLNKEITKLVIVSFFVAAPLVYYLMQNWLDNFAYKISVSPGTIFIVGVSILFMALLVVSYQSFMTARTNPVEAIKDE